MTLQERIAEFNSIVGPGPSPEEGILSLDFLSERRKRLILLKVSGLSYREVALGE